MNDFFKVASIVSFIGAAAFIYTAFENGKMAMIGMAIVMLCNGINFWMKSTEKSSNADKKVENAEE